MGPVLHAKPEKLTREFGIWLARYLRINTRYRGYSVFFAQWDDQENRYYITVKGFCGKRVTRADRLTEIDLLVVNEENEVILLIEIEEIGISSKELLGDIFATLLCERFVVIKRGVHTYFDVVPTTKLIVAAVDTTHNAKRDHFEQVVVPNLQRTMSFNIKDIEFVFGNDTNSSFDNFKNKMSEIFP